MNPASLLELGVYSSEWIKNFYDQAGAEIIRQEWCTSGLDSKDPGEWIRYVLA